MHFKHWFLINFQDGDESLIPPVIPLASEHVSDDGIYLLENGLDCLIYIGNLVDSGILQQLFGITTSDELPTQVAFTLTFWVLSICLTLLLIGTNCKSQLGLRPQSLSI